MILAKIFNYKIVIYILLIGLFLGISSVGYSQAIDSKTNSEIKKRLNQLDILADSILSGNREKRNIYERKFFDLFPSTFDDFIKLYGYTENTHGHITFSIGYQLAIKHITDVFGNLKSISKGDYYQKIINIAYGSSWQADALNYLEAIAESELETNPLLFAKTLNKQKESKLIGFVNFISANPTEGKDKYDHYCKLIDKISPKLDGYKRVKNYLYKPCITKD